MKISARLDVPRLNLAAYEALLRETLGDSLARGAALWLGTVEPMIPVWSGASRGTFLKLASEIGFELTAIIPVSGAPDRINLGLKNSSGIVELGGGVFTFTYETTLKHLIFNEFNNANLFGFNLRQPGPYQFQERARPVLKRVAHEARLPDPRRAMNTISVRI